MIRNRWVLVADLLGLALAALGAFILRLDWFLDEYTPVFIRYLILALIIKPPIFMAFGLYARYWRLASTRELLEILTATIVSAAAMAVAVSVGVGFSFFDGFPRSVLLIDWLLTLVYAGGLRVSIRLVAEARERSDSGGNHKRVLIAGAGQAGAMMVREIGRNPALRLRPIGFLDDDTYKQGKRILGVPVIGGLKDLSKAVERLQAEEVVIAMPRASGEIVRSLIDACEHQRVKFRIIPGVFELLQGSVEFSRLREVDITDLLRRDQIRPPAESGSFVTGKTVLVTGAGGSIGSELCRQVSKAGPKQLVMVGHGENSIFARVNELRRSYPDTQVVPVIADIRNRARMAQVFERYRPQVVFHAAAHKHVPLMEENPEEAITNNIVGTSIVVDLAEATGVERLTFISTDKAVAPSNIMGASKRMAEAIVRSAARRGRRFMVVRFGNVLGSRGSVVPMFKEQIARGGPVTVTHPDVTRFFMTIPEAVHLVLTAAGMGDGGELFVLNMGRPVRIVDLAQDLIRLSGASDKHVPIVFTGLRPGEKLEEELWEAAATVEATGNSDILRIVEPEPPNDDLQAVVRRLTDLAQSGDHAEVAASLLSWAQRRGTAGAGESIESPTPKALSVSPPPRNP